MGSLVSSEIPPAACTRVYDTAYYAHAKDPRPDKEIRETRGARRPDPFPAPQDHAGHLTPRAGGGAARAFSHRPQVAPRPAVARARRETLSGARRPHEPL